MTARFLLFLGFSLCTSFSSLSLSHSLLLVRFLLAWRVSRVCNVAKRNITTNHFECWVSDFFTVSLFGYALYLYCVCVCLLAFYLVRATVSMRSSCTVFLQLILVKSIRHFLSSYDEWMGGCEKSSGKNFVMQNVCHRIFRRRRRWHRWCKDTRAHD